MRPNFIKVADEATPAVHFGNVFDAFNCDNMPIYHGSAKIFEAIPRARFSCLATLNSSEISKPNAFCETDSCKAVSDDCAAFRDPLRAFSYYSAPGNFPANRPFSIVAERTLP